MSFYDRLRESRINAGYTQEQLAQKIGVAKSTLSGYESGNRDPSMYTISKIMEVLNVKANFLWQDETRELYKNEASPEEFENIIKKYRTLDPHGKEMVDFTLLKEWERSTAEAEKSNVVPLTLKEDTTYYVNAAHPIEDATEEDKSFDENLMDDENF